MDNNSRKTKKNNKAAVAAATEASACAKLLRKLLPKKSGFMRIKQSESEFEEDFFLGMDYEAFVNFNISVVTDMSEEERALYTSIFKLIKNGKTCSVDLEIAIIRDNEQVFFNEKKQLIFVTPP